MPQIPRLAVGAVQNRVDVQPVTWALLAYLAAHGLQVQHFLSRACFTPCDGASGTTGLSSRHLDSWLMTPEVCRDIFFRAARSADMAIVEGVFGSAADRPGTGQRISASHVSGLQCGKQVGSRIRGDADDYDPAAAIDVGTLGPICDWLDLPRLVVLDARQLRSCVLPVLPPADGILLDYVAGPQQAARLQTQVETMTGMPVLGALEAMPTLRQAIQQLPRGAKLPAHLYKPLARCFSRYASFDKLKTLATSRPFQDIASASSFRRQAVRGSRLRVAVAYDAAFHCYFPDVLEALEWLGAAVVDFSPCRDERLPANTDIVYLGCGHPEGFAELLAANQCMMSALRDHARHGRRIYAEGGGLAYLCRELIAPPGKRWPMVGLLPAIASLNPRPDPPTPVELPVGRSTWLATPGTTLQGYRNTLWNVQALSNRASLVSGSQEHLVDLLGCYHVVGSRVHLNFAAQPAFLRHFFQPCRVAQKRVPPA